MFNSIINIKPWDSYFSWKRENKCLFLVTQHKIFSYLNISSNLFSVMTDVYLVISPLIAYYHIPSDT